MNERSALQSSSKALEVNEPQSGWVLAFSSNMPLFLTVFKPFPPKIQNADSTVL